MPVHFTPYLEADILQLMRCNFSAFGSSFSDYYRYWMDMRTFFTALLSAGAFCSGNAQFNLVPNPSFEDHTACPDLGQFDRLLHWYEPNAGTSDYYHTCSPFPPTHLGPVPTNFLGHQHPRTGEAYAGFSAGSPVDAAEWREYIGTELTDTLKAGHYYCVEFYVSLGNISLFSVGTIGALLTDTAVLAPGSRNIFQTPHIESRSGILNDTVNWMHISARYQARGGEKFITIGNFRNNAGTTFGNEPGWGDPRGTLAYYYIDDVSVTECEAEEPGSPVSETDVFIPNVFSPNGDGENDYFIIENLPPGYSFHLYNRWGESVHRQVPSLQGGNPTVRWSGHHRNGNPCSEGVYYYLLVLPDGTVRKGTVQLLR